MRFFKNVVKHKTLYITSVKMILHYENKMNGLPVNKNCIVCNLYRKDNTKAPDCTYCFNSPFKTPFLTICNCLAFKTNDKDIRYSGYRLIFWRKVLEWVESIPTLPLPYNFIPLKTVRKKLEEIDNSIL